MTSPLDTALGAGSAVGRYFSIISVLPAALLVMYIWILFSADLATASVDMRGVLHAFRALELQDVAWFVGASLLLALALYPLQFAMTQLLEGYWGATSFGIRLARSGVMRHRKKALWAEEVAAAAHRDFVLQGSALLDGEESTPEWKDLDEEERSTRELGARDLLEEREGDQIVHLYLLKEAAMKVRDAYPVDLERCMPTRFGNILRRYEDKSGKQYNINTIIVAPHLSLVARPEYYAYVRDRQKVLDLSIGLCAVAAVATALTGLVLADDGPWVFATFVPFGFAYLAYLGSVAAASGYCVAIETVTDLSRFRLYEALHLPIPTSLSQERHIATLMIKMLAGEQVDGLLRHATTERRSAPAAYDPG